MSVPSSIIIREPKWGKMIGLSTVFHLLLLLLFLFASDPVDVRKIDEVIYQVKLVDLSSSSLKIRKTGSNKTIKLGKGISKAVSTKRIGSLKKEKKSVLISKKHIQRKPDIELKKTTTTKLIEEALAKIKPKVKISENDMLEQALNKISEEVKNKRSVPRVKNINSISIRMYQLAIGEKIKGNWSYPVALAISQNKECPEAVVILKVKENGSILDIHFKKRSSNALFNNSVIKAVRKSDPLPAFPDGYHKTSDEIEITFNLNELQS